MRILILLVVLFWSFTGMGQGVSESKLESLEDDLTGALSELELAQKAEDDERIFYALVELANFYKGVLNYSKAIDYFKQSLAYSSPLARGRAEAHLNVQNSLARTLFNNKEYEECLEVFEDARFLNTIGQLYDEQITNREFEARALIELGRFEEARDNYLQIQGKALIQLQDTALAIQALTKASEVSNMMNDYEMTLEILQEADGLEQQCQNDPETHILINRGIALLNLGEKKEALAHLIRAEEISDPHLGYVQHLISKLYQAEGNKKNALKYVLKAIEDARLRADVTLLNELYKTSATIYQEMKQFDKALQSFKNHLVTENSLLKKTDLRNNELDKIQDYLNEAEIRFKQSLFEQELKESELRQQELSLQAARLETERERLEKEKNAQELSLVKAREEKVQADLKAAELDRQRIEQEARLLRQQNLTLQRQRELEQLEEQRIQESLKAQANDAEQSMQIQLLEERETRAAFEAAEKERTLKKNRLWAMILGLGLIIAILAVLNTRRLNKRLATQNSKIEEQKVEVEAERERAEQLLLNVLPKSIAEELKLNGVAAPEKYDSATVLFTDFVGFTAISSTLAPEEIIEELNICFTEFDQIAQRHRLEKIKTIGDSYMCAGGIPTTNDSHAGDAIFAGKEMVAFMNKRNAQHKKEGRALWPIRVGIHTGELVAGVVGSAKFAYDIWGDTVNVASRMERGAEPDSINISGETYNLIKDDFDCQYRGEIDVKNKGLMGMYRVG